MNTTGGNIEDRVADVLVVTALQTEWWLLSSRPISSCPKTCRSAISPYLHWPACRDDAMCHSRRGGWTWDAASAPPGSGLHGSKVSTLTSPPRRRCARAKHRVTRIYPANTGVDSGRRHCTTRVRSHGSKQFGQPTAAVTALCAGSRGARCSG